MTERGSGERQSAKSCKELHINPAAAEGVGFGYLRIQQSGNAELLRCVEGQAAVLPDGGGGEGVVHGGPVQQVGPVPGDRLILTILRGTVHLWISPQNPRPSLQLEIRSNIIGRQPSHDSTQTRYRVMDVRSGSWWTCPAR